jgi:hypothetical protein
MDHKRILDDAISTVDSRGQDYGNVDEMFERTCLLYNLMTGESMTPWLANMFMACLKMSRVRVNRAKADNYIDCINYLSFAAQFAQATTDRVVVSIPLPSTAEEWIDHKIRRAAKIAVAAKEEEPQP